VDFQLTQSQRDLADLTRQILADRAAPDRLAELEHAGDRFDPVLWADLAAAGVLSAALPGRAGGDGFGLAEQCSVLIELGRTGSPAPYLESIVLGAGAIAAFGDDAQVDRWAKPAAAGEVIITAALEEPDGRGAAEPSTRAEPAMQGWRLSGTKIAVPAGPTAGLFLVPAMAPSGTLVFCVTPDDPGVRVREQALTDGPGAAEVDLAGVTVAEDRQLPTSDNAAAWLTDRGMVGVCALQLGVAERALELTAQHARTREQFGRPVGAFQAVAQRLADAYIDVEAMRLTLWQAAWRLEAGLPCETEIATAKFWAAEAGHRVAHTAVHVHGGVGIDVSHPLHRYFAAAKRYEFALGGATAQLLRLGTMLAAT
jgi:acyl-CoA dehydrogenase